MRMTHDGEAGHSLVGRLVGVVVELVCTLYTQYPYYFWFRELDH